jgi:hypothetical protein
MYPTNTQEDYVLFDPQYSRGYDDAEITHRMEQN